MSSGYSGNLTMKTLLILIPNYFRLLQRSLLFRLCVQKVLLRTIRLKV